MQSADTMRKIAYEARGGRWKSATVHLTSDMDFYVRQLVTYRREFEATLPREEEVAQARKVKLSKLLRKLEKAKDDPKFLPEWLLPTELDRTLAKARRSLGLTDEIADEKLKASPNVGKIRLLSAEYDKLTDW